jgi:hypothetical protein
MGSPQKKLLLGRLDFVWHFIQHMLFVVSEIWLLDFLVRLLEAFCYVGNLAIGFLFQLLEALCCVRNLAIGFLVQLLESRCAG